LRIFVRLVDELRELQPPREANGYIRERHKHKTQPHDDVHHPRANQRAADHVAGIVHACVDARERVERGEDEQPFAYTWIRVPRAGDTSMGILGNDETDGR